VRGIRLQGWKTWRELLVTRVQSRKEEGSEKSRRRTWASVERDRGRKSVGGTRGDLASGRGAMGCFAFGGGKREVG